MNTQGLVRPIKSSSVSDILMGKIVESQANRPERVCFWPDKYDDSAEGGFRFLLNLYTWNEAEGQTQAFPNKAFLEEYAYEWHEGLTLGRTLVTEKCRRMVISWCARGLELHQMGMKRTDCILVGEDFEAASKHVWRLKFLYEGLQERNKGWNLPKSSDLKYEGEKKLKNFSLPNGSSCNYANGQAGGLQGDGVRIITMEEFGMYRYASSMLAQAKIITQGSAGSPGGFVNVITNASSNPQWQLVKRGAMPIGG